MLNPAWRSLPHVVDQVKLSRFQLQANWPQLVGPTLAPHCQPQRMQGRSLWVLTRGPVWSQEIMLQQQSILEKISRRFPKLKADQLRCRVGTLRTISESPPPPPPADLSAIALPASVEYRLQRVAAEVADPQLRESLLRALRQKERRDVWLRQQGALACVLCGALQDQRTCRGCRQQERRDRRQQLFKLLGKQPWITFQEAADQVVPLRQAEFHTARRQLLSILLMNYYELRDSLTTGQPLPSILRQLLVEICMLSTGTPWDQLEDRHIIFSLGKTWAQAYRDDKAPPPYEKKLKEARKPKPTPP